MVLRQECSRRRLWRRLPRSPNRRQIPAKTVNRGGYRRQTLHESPQKHARLYQPSRFFRNDPRPYEGEQRTTKKGRVF